MKTVKIIRHWQDRNQTFGTLLVFDADKKPVFSSSVIERGWRNNEKNTSCVPAGVYDLVYEYSPKFKAYLWEAKNIPNRSECKFHAANSWFELNGCFAPGIDLEDFNDDGYIDVKNSYYTLMMFHSALHGEQKVKLNIVNDET